MLLSVNGVACRYEQTGEGPDVLALHGWGGCVESFAPVIQRLSRKRRVTALDFPGHGRSGAPAQEGWSVTEYRDFTLALLDKLGIGKTDIVAHSFGARVAILLASSHPERVGRMVLTGAAGLIKPKTASQLLREKAGKAAKAVCPEGMRRKLATAFGSADYKALSEEMRRTFVKIVNQDLRPCLPNIRASTLLIWGRDDTETPLSFGRIMEKEIPDAGLVVLEGGHFAYLEQLEAFLRITENFLKA